MFKTRIFITTFIFITLLIITSVIKNKTRVTEKQIYILNSKILIKQKSINEAQLDFHYLTSPAEIEKKLKELAFNDYQPIKYSNIFLNISDFTKIQDKISKVKTLNEKKFKQKKNQKSFYFEDYLETNKKNKILKKSNNFQDRIYILFFFFFSLILIFSIKITHISLDRKTTFNIEKHSSQFSLIRRDIVDRNGEIISRNINTFHAAIDPKMVKDKKNFLIKLRVNFPDLPFNEIKKKLDDNKYFRDQKKELIKLKKIDSGHLEKKQLNLNRFKHECIRMEIYSVILLVKLTTIIMEYQVLKSISIEN